MEKNRFLFVYGSLRSGFNSDAYQYISRYFTLIDNAKVKGVLYDLGDYPAALPADKDFFITGELYYLKNEEEYNWAMEQLDDYEGLHVEAGERPLYRRDIVTVYARDNEVMAWVYWYNNDIEGKPRIESGDVLEYLRHKQ